MSNPNTIPELLGIIAIIIIIMSVVGVIIGNIYEGIINHNKKNLSNQNSNEILSKKTLIKPTNLNHDWINSNKSKFEISSMFYDFCFSKEIAKFFLQENEIRKTIVLGMILYEFENESLLEKTLKKFIKKKYGLTLGESSYYHYIINGYRFYIDVMRVRDENCMTSYYEILSNDFEKVKNEEGIEMAIAKEFILYCENNMPIAIFVIVYDPILDTNAIRRVFENGQSLKLTFIKNNDDSGTFDYIKEYVRKNF